LIVALREQVAISSGSACTSASYQNSHVLTAMQLPKERVQEATRWSWCHRTPFPNWQAVLSKIQLLS
jgi:cysteine desulfurase